MNKDKLFIILFTCLVTTSFAQTVKRITANMNLQTELTNATNGDIFMVEGGFYGDINVTKQVALIGTGYFLGNGTQATPATARTGRVHFRTGSAGSMITGFEINGFLNITTSSISVTRNNITEAIQIGVNDALTWGSTANNVIIKQNLARRLEILGVSGGSITGFSCKNNIFSQGFHLQGNISGEIINNTFDRDIVGDEQGYGVQSYISQTQTSGNYVCGKINVVFKNNILTNISSWTGDWCPVTSYPTDIFLNNILNGKSSSYGAYAIPTNLGTTNTIITTTQLNNLYIGYPTNSPNFATDARNQLATTSPAKGAGENGTDCGAFGGDEPYVLSGIPFVPTIYELKVPQTVSQGGTLNVQIKAKTNN
jgi:hypothetical protein